MFFHFCECKHIKCYPKIVILYLVEFQSVGLYITSSSPMFCTNHALYIMDHVLSLLHTHLSSDPFHSLLLRALWSTRPSLLMYISIRWCYSSWCTSKMWLVHSNSSWKVFTSSSLAVWNKCTQTLIMHAGRFNIKCLNVDHLTNTIGDVP